MTHPFSVTCYRYDVGIFTAFGARIKQIKSTYPNPPKAVNNLPVRRDPRFIDRVFYDVILFTNPECSQSFACYRSKDLIKAQNYLDNFILLCKKGYRYIDLEKIPDIPYRPSMFPPCPAPGPYPFYPWNPYHPWFYKNDKFDTHLPDSEIDPRYLNDPRKNPYYDSFETLTREPRYAGPVPKLPPCPPCPPTPHDFDCDECPKYDGEIVSFDKPIPPPHPLPPYPYPPFMPEPHCPDYDPSYRPENRPPCPPPPFPPVPPPPFPPCPPPPYFPPPPCPVPTPPRPFIEVYYGNGGFTMGGAVTSDNITEITPNTLRVMLEKNFHPTYPNMDPKDHIEVKHKVLECLPGDFVFKTNMTVAGEWSFFMIPDRFYKYVKNFNWYYKDNVSDGLWKEIDKTLVQTTFTIQDNGIKYFVSAIKLNGRYDMRFARSGRDFNNEPTPGYDNLETNYVITLQIQNCVEKYTVTVKDLSAAVPYTRTLVGFINDEYTWTAAENHVYELKVYDKSDVAKETALMTTYFVAIPDENYAQGFCTWNSGLYDPNKSIVENGFVKVTELVAPRTPSNADRLILMNSEIDP